MQTKAPTCLRWNLLGFHGLGLAFISTAIAAPEPPATPPAHFVHPSLAIYASEFVRRPHNRGFQVIAAVWADGRIVWPAPATNGTTGFLQGRFSPEKLQALLTRLRKKGAFEDKALAQPWVGPNSGYTTILVEDGARQLKMRSWHEKFEKNPNLVVLASGVTALKGQDREELLENQPEDYRRFRATWAEIRRFVEEIMPEKGEPYDGIVLGPGQ